MANLPGPDYAPTIPMMLRHIAAQYGDNEAIVRDGRRLTYKQLEEQSARVAKALLAAGVTKGARIGLLSPPTPDFVTMLFAVGRIGAVVVPMSTLYQAPELQWVLANAGIDHLVIADHFLRHDYLARLEEALPGLSGCGPGPLHLVAAPRLRNIFVLGKADRPWSRDAAELFSGSDAISSGLLHEIENLVTPADPLCIIHTSGSTATPKGVIHGQGPFIRHTWQMGHDFYPFATGTRIITPRAMFWVAGLVATLTYALHMGACLITITDSSPETVLDLIRNEGGTALAGDSGWFDVLRDSPEFAAAGYDVVRLNMDSAAIARNGKFLSPQVDARYGAPQHVPNARFARSFGMTETLGAHTSTRWDELLPEDLPSWQGRAVPGVTLKIVHPETREPLPPGETGELLVKGYCLTIGLNGLERHETFDEEGFYATGDLCVLHEDGWLKFESRLGEMIKIHGANVAPLEVELAMMGLMGIEKPGVVGIGEGQDTILVAGVVMAPGRELDEAGVIAELKKRLSSFKVPKHIVALSPDEMPMVGSGKIKKAELTSLLNRRFNH